MLWISVGSPLTFFLLELLKTFQVFLVSKIFRIWTVVPVLYQDEPFLESIMTLLLASWAWLSPGAFAYHRSLCALQELVGLSAEQLFSQAWSPSCYAVTMSFRGEVADPRLLKALFLRCGTDNCTGMCKGRSNLTHVCESWKRSKALGRRYMPLRSSGPWMERPITLGVVWQTVSQQLILARIWPDCL